MKIRYDPAKLPSKKMSSNPPPLPPLIQYPYGMKNARSITHQSNTNSNPHCHDHHNHIHILSASYQTFTTNSIPNKFLGACIDTGAARSVCGDKQLQAYFEANKTLNIYQPSNVTYKFGDHTYRSKGTFEFRIALNKHSYIPIYADIMETDVPLFIGLQDLKQNGLLLIYLEDVLIHCPKKKTRCPVSYKNGHVFIEWYYTKVYFTRAELMRLHLLLLHPSTDKLFQLLKRAQPEKVDESIHRMLHQISMACEQCREFTQRPFRFRASIPPNQIVFNHEVAIELMWLEGNPILHVVDTHTGFQNATILKGKLVYDIWYAFIECLASSYIGYPSIIRLDQEAGFAAESLKDLASAHGIVLQFSGAQSHNSIGSGERYHAPL